jgi:hypothetical protein
MVRILLLDNPRSATRKHSRMFMTYRSCQPPH